MDFSTDLSGLLKDLAEHLIKLHYIFVWGHLTNLSLNPDDKKNIQGPVLNVIKHSYGCNFLFSLRLLLNRKKAVLSLFPNF